MQICGLDAKQPHVEEATYR